MAGTLLDVIELSCKIAWRARRNAGNRSDAAQVLAMADRAGQRLSAATSGDKSLAFCHRPSWHIGNKPGSGVAKDLGMFDIHRRFDYAIADRLGACRRPLQRNPHSAMAGGLGH